MADQDADCVFCQIVAGVIPTTRLREDADTLVFPDLAPVAPVHVLVVPKKHVRDIGELGGDPVVAAAVLAAIGAFAAETGLSDYRTVFNTGAKAGQSVFHAHAHVMSGRALAWPPG